jgi:hypothetical protein
MHERMEILTVDFSVGAVGGCVVLLGVPLPACLWV